MKKKHIGILLCGLLCIGVLSVVTIRYFAGRSAPALDIVDDEIPMTEFAPEDVAIPQATPEAKEIQIQKIEREAPQVIPEPSEETKVNPSADTIEKENGTVQTRDWESQKQLPDDAELRDTEEPPEYVPSGNTSTPPPSSSTPDPGDSKTVDGSAYTYVPGFGWVKNGDGGSTDYVDAPTTGNKVGH